MSKQHILAVDLGNESGRVMSLYFDGNCIEAGGAYRFPNDPVTVRGILHWDVLRLWHHVQQGINRATSSSETTEKPAGIGVASFGVDFGLLDKHGKLLGNPVHMRDTRTQDIAEWVFERVPEAVLFRRTGVGAHPINTLFQLAALVRNDDPQLAQAHTLLTMPNLINYWLTGEKRSEFTHSTTTQCFSPALGDWDKDLLVDVGIPTGMFPEVVQPGTPMGSHSQIPVYAVASHDTASAVVAVPTETEHYAYISSGTWSLLGLEVPNPVTSDKALRAGLTNEGGFGGTYRMLSLIMGMWLVQECRRTWTQAGESHSYDALFELSDANPFAALIDPDDPILFTPGDMPGRIRQLCKQNGQPIPQTPGQVIRCILRSLALKYAHVLEQQVAAAAQPVDVIHVVGGGAQNRLLCQMTANATGRPVLAGPVEATALGNALVQLVAMGEIADLAEARAVVRRSYPVTRYEPRDVATWAQARERFAGILT